MLKTLLPFLFACTCLLPGCATKHHSMQALDRCVYPNITPNDTITLAYFDGLLENSNNKRAALWAQRKGYHVMAVKLINNTPHIIHGFQLEFQFQNHPLEVIPNQWAAKKIRQRAQPFILLGILPLLGELIIKRGVNELVYGDDEDNNNINPQATYSASIMESNRQQRKNANTDLLEEMIHLEIFRKKLYPGEPAYGIVVLKSKKSPNNLQVIVNLIEEQKNQPRVRNSIF